MYLESNNIEFGNVDAAISSGRTFIDVFAGCGGLSLGLMNAGWKGLFAIEKDQFAFETLKTNLIESSSGSNFDWPVWLPKSAHSVSDVLENYATQLAKLEGKVDLMAGGPPCQGFSSAGRRDASDPRNSLMGSYLQLVRRIKPRIVLIENVHGITVDFVDKRGGDKPINYADRLIEELGADYIVHWKMITVSDFGVPQKRTRFFLLAERKSLSTGCVDPFELLENERRRFLRSKSLIAPTSSMAAISDLEVSRNGIDVCPDSPGFNSIAYSKPRTNYQRLMRVGSNLAPSNTRLAKHRPDISKRFGKIIEQCNAEGRLNTSLSKEMREAFGLRKLALRVLDPDCPAPTITSMPDDLLHYKEPRTLTVRENARLQSFPDWFEFRGKYTTGGLLRKKEVPRFTQVANAVPPLMAEAIGQVLVKWIASSNAGASVKI